MKPALLVWVVAMLGSLLFGGLSQFFFGSTRHHVQGIDLWSTPKAFLNLLDGRSMYDSWGGAPYMRGVSTWFLMHPIFGATVAAIYAPFEPWAGYALSVLVTLGLLLASARMVSALTMDGRDRAVIFGLFLCAFPVYWLLYVGNQHGFIVLAITLILVGIYKVGIGDPGARFVAAGLLLSLFTKPIVLLMVPVLLIRRETRKVTIWCLGAYVAVSVACLVIPAINPAPIGLPRVVALALDPAFVKGHMNIYSNGFNVMPDMKDVSVHWFNLVAQSDFRWNHIDTFSLSALLDNLSGVPLPNLLYQLPIVLVVAGAFSLLLYVPYSRVRIELSLLLLMLSVYAFFLSYHTVWEYQYTSLLPCVAMIYLLYRRGEIEKWPAWVFFAFSAIGVYLPSPYFWAGDQTLAAVNWTRGTRPMAALTCFLVLGWITVVRMRRAI